MVCIKLLRDPAVKAYKFGTLKIPTPTLCPPSWRPALPHIQALEDFIAKASEDAVAE